MPLLICKVDKELVIPPKMRGIFPNEETLRIKFTANKPTSVPDYVASYYIKNYPRIYWLSEKQPPKPEANQRPETTAGKKNESDFDAIEWIATNIETYEEAVQELDRQKLFQVCKVLRFKNYINQKDDRLRERIIQDIKIKNKQSEEIGKEAE